MDKYIFILVMIVTTTFGIRVIGASNTNRVEKLLGTCIWGLSVLLLIGVALGDLRP